MSVKFREINHEYSSIDPTAAKSWKSVTSVIGEFKKPFDAEKVSKRVSKNKNSKWYGMTPEQIREIWKSENRRATDLGSWYHLQREHDICEIETIDRDGVSIPIITCDYDGEYKIAASQKLAEGIYPEILLFLESAGICGQADRVEVIGDRVDVYDYKTNKEIKTEGFYNKYAGEYQKMSKPVSHLQDCNFNHYSLQLSIYMYIILRHNPHLKPGKIELHHIKFKEEPEKNEYGNPIYLKDKQGNFIVDQIVPYTVPYLKKEVKDIIEYVKAQS